jgi:hypothetical protein
MPVTQAKSVVSRPAVNPVAAPPESIPFHRTVADIAAILFPRRWANVNGTQKHGDAQDFPTPPGMNSGDASKQQ